MELVRFGTEVALEMEDRREDDYEQNKVLFYYRINLKNILAKTSFQNFCWKWKQIRFFWTRPFDSCSKSSWKRVTCEYWRVKVEDKTTISSRIRQAACSRYTPFRYRKQQFYSEFNQDHTILDLKKFCDPHAGGRKYELRSGYPPKPLDLTSTSSLVDAKLLNETVIQRLL